MKRILLILCLAICFDAAAQMDTVKITDDISISYLVREDTVMISTWKLDNIVELIQMQDKTFKDCQSQAQQYEIGIDLANKQIDEYAHTNRLLQERADIYQGAYELSADRIKEMNAMWQTSVLQTTQERKRGILTGTLFGAGGGIIIGIITTAILLK
jgi:hypothetical protein